MYITLFFNSAARMLLVCHLLSAFFMTLDSMAQPDLT